MTSAAASDHLESKIFGLVIRSHASGEADTVLRVLTHSLGKISVYARGVRRSKRRFGGNIEIFDSGEFEISRGRGSLLELRSFTPSSTLKTVREDFDKLAAASLLCECVDFLVKEEQTQDGEHEKVFTDTELALRAVEEAGSRVEIGRAVFLGLSSILSTTGFLDHGSAGQGGVKSLLMLLKRVEDCAERQLSSKKAFISVLSALKSDRVKAQTT